MPGPTRADRLPTIGDVVAVRGQRLAVADATPGGADLLVSLQRLEDGRYGESLEIWYRLVDI